jgi:chromosome segregation ATPase
MLIRFVDKALFSCDSGPHFMRTISEHLDDLDRMVDGGAAKSEIRSQIAFIGREVAALEAEYAQLAEAHAKLQEAHLQLQASKTETAKEIADIQAQQARRDSESPRFSGSGGQVERSGG